MQPITITAMQIERGEQLLNECMADTVQLFDRLTSDGLIEPVFKVESYDCITPAAQLAYIRDAARLAFKPELGAPFRVRDLLFQILMCFRPEDEESWLFQVNHRGAPFNYAMSGVVLDEFKSAWTYCLQHRGVTPPVVPPDVLWLPEAASECFEGNHGIAGQVLHRWGNCALLCPPDYYHQILWHECLHLCFGCDECYDDLTRTSTCDLPTCIMQYEPHHSRPGLKDWLCDGQKRAIAGAHREQLKRLRAGCLV